MLKALLFSIIMLITILGCGNIRKVTDINTTGTEAIYENNTALIAEDTIRTPFEHETDGPDYVSDNISARDSLINEYDYSRVYDYTVVEGQDTVRNYDTIPAGIILPAASIDTLDVTQTGDSIVVAPRKKADAQFDSPINYASKEKGYIDFDLKKAYLFTEAEVKYEGITLTSDYMEIDFDKNEVYSYGVTDSAQQVTGKPVFKEGEEEFQADSIRYNFNSKRGIVRNVVTENEGSFLHAGKTKLDENRHAHMIDGRYTTCDLIDCPHYYFRLTKAKVIPDDKIISGPAYLVIADVPTPLGLPFGFFPNKKGAASGVLIPAIRNEQRRGIGLEKGGYYWAISDKLAVSLLGDIFLKGSWKVGAVVDYKVRYKYHGFVNLDYNKNIFGYKGLPDYSTENLYSFRWRFTQDSKARPNSNFSAEVNLSSSKYDAVNSINPGSVMQSTKSSSINYSHNFANTPFNISASFLHSQNNRTGAVDFTLPRINLNMSRIYPLKRRVQVGESRWYEKIGLTYSMDLTNKIRTNENSFFDIRYDSITNGISHRATVSTNFKFLKYTTLTPSFNYNERWYIKTMQKSWEFLDGNDDPKYAGELVSNYKPGFSRAWNYDASLEWSTNIYGTFNYNNDRIKALRHALTPSVRMSFSPDFTKTKYNYYGIYESLRINERDGQYYYDTIPVQYSRFEGLPNSFSPTQGSGHIAFSLQNNLEMKVRDKSDTTATDKKVKILDRFDISTQYNLFRDSLNWDPLAISGSTRISFLNLNFNARFDPYAYDYNSSNNPVRVNTYVFQVDSLKGKIARLTSANVTLGFSLNSNGSTKREKTYSERDNMDPYRTLYGYPQHYVDFEVPWRINVDYSFYYTKPGYKADITQTLNFSGDISLTKKWKVSFSSGYDFQNKKVTYTTFNIYRDLHCWEASLHLVPFGSYKSYVFTINVKSAMLQDLKLNKRRNWYDNFSDN